MPIYSHLKELTVRLLKIVIPAFFQRVGAGQWTSMRDSTPFGRGAGTSARSLLRFAAIWEASLCLECASQVRHRAPITLTPWTGTRIALVFLASLFLFQQWVLAQVKETKRVLLLDDLGDISSPGFSEVDQAVFAGLQESRFQIELYHESLEITLFPDKSDERRFYEEFVRKYSNRKPDVIIAAGSASFKFVAELKDSRLQDIPIVFCAILGDVPDRSKQPASVTGVLGKLHPAETLDVALRLFPGTKHVVVVGGSGKFDRSFEAVAKRSFQKYESKLEFTYLIDLTMPALLDQLKHLPSNTLVYHTALTRDAAESRFIDSAQALPLVTGASNAPVFVMDDVDLRSGSVGGDLVNWADDGRLAAEMAVRILNGEKPADIPIAISKDAYMFDWRALRRWGIKESDLPPGSILLNRQPTLWEAYKRYILAGILLLLAQTAIIAALLLQRMKRKQAEANLRESEKRFRLVANSAPVMIWMSGTDKMCSFFNEGWLNFCGRALEDELGDGWATGVHPQDLNRCLETYSAAFDARVKFEMEYRLRRQDGEYRWVHDVGAPRYAADGSFQGYIGSCSDVTERKQSEEALLTMSRRLLTAQEEERARIARELHDDLSQRMALLQIGIDDFGQKMSKLSPIAKQRLEDIATIAKEVSSDMHNLSHELHPSMLETLGLVAAMGGLCREITRQFSLKVQFTYSNVNERMPKDVTLCLFRVVQETLRNAVKHSGAEAAHVALSGGGDRIELSVSDNGSGFDPEIINREAGIGLISLQERVKLVRGEISIESKISHGTRIYVRVPLAMTSDYPAAKAAEA